MTPHSALTEKELKGLRKYCEYRGARHMRAVFLPPTVLRLLDMIEARDRAIEVLRESIKTISQYRHVPERLDKIVKEIGDYAENALAEAERLLSGEGK